MDYIYGKLNLEVEKLFYTGTNTETAKTVVNNDDLSIQVDVKNTKGNLQIKNLEDNELNSFNGANDLYIELPKVSDKVFQTEFNEFRDDTNNKFRELQDDYSQKIIDEGNRAINVESKLRTDLDSEKDRAIAEENKKVNIDSPYKYSLDEHNLTSTYAYTVVPDEKTPKLIKVINTKSAEGLSIAQRTDDGNLCVNETPMYDYHAASKKYVDTAIGNLTFGDVKVDDGSRFVDTEVVVVSNASGKNIESTPIKTINNQSILGSGNIEISGGSSTPSDYTYVDGEALYITKSTASLPAPLIVEKNFADGEEMTIDGVVKYRFNFTESEWNNLIQNKAVLYVKMGNDTDSASPFIVFTKTYQVRNNTTDNYYTMYFSSVMSKNRVHTFNLDNSTVGNAYGLLVLNSEE